MSQRAPFTTMAGARVFDDSKGGVRVYLGSGDRDQIKVRDTDAADGGTCALDNLRGCVRNNLHGGRQPGHLPDRLRRDRRIADGRMEVHRERHLADHQHLRAGIEREHGGGLQRSGPGEHPVSSELRGTAMADPTTAAPSSTNTLNCDFDGGSGRCEECLDTSGKPTDQPGVPFTSPHHHQHAVLLGQALRSADLHQPAADDLVNEPDEPTTSIR